MKARIRESKADKVEVEFQLVLGANQENLSTAERANDNDSLAGCYVEQDSLENIYMPLSPVSPTPLLPAVSPDSLLSSEESLLPQLVEKTDMFEERRPPQAWTIEWEPQSTKQTIKSRTGNNSSIRFN
jgi:hypothetical protein